MRKKILDFAVLPVRCKVLVKDTYPNTWVGKMQDSRSTMMLTAFGVDEAINK